MANARSSDPSAARPTSPEAPPSCPSEEASVGVKGSADPAPSREWTTLSVEEERRLLTRELEAARGCGDECEVRRIEARLRLLTP
jgi:hypothetical protein